jgi:hypothetical protein
MMAARRLELIIPERLWEQLEVLERKSGIRKEDIFLRAVVNLIDGVRCNKCGTIIKEFQ